MHATFGLGIYDAVHTIGNTHRIVESAEGIDIHIDERLTKFAANIVGKTRAEHHHLIAVMKQSHIVGYMYGGAKIHVFDF